MGRTGKAKRPLLGATRARGSEGEVVTSGGLGSRRTLGLEGTPPVGLLCWRGCRMVGARALL